MNKFSIFVVVLLIGGTAAVGSVWSVDASGDGMTIAQDVYHGTNPIKADTDGDGVTDHDEVFVYETNPTQTDSDGDGVTDGNELFAYDTDPLDSHSDNDSLDDGVEVNQYGSDPTQVDTDSDGLDDGVEVNQYNTNPTRKDTDSDGLTDGNEVNKYQTDPTAEDTSGDGISDFVSVYGPREYPNIYGGVDPLQYDVILEVTYMKESPFRDAQPALDRQTIEQIEQSFATAPIENPDGTTGVNINLIGYPDSGAEYQSQTTIEQYYNSTKNETHVSAGYGTHHALIVNDARIEGRETNGRSVIGATKIGSPGMIVQRQETSISTGMTVVHELGHSFGLSNQQFDGIDSTEYTTDEYPSIMNYNHVNACIGAESFDGCQNGVNRNNAFRFSTGTDGDDDFDDWEVIKENVGDNVDDNTIQMILEVKYDEVTGTKQTANTTA